MDTAAESSAGSNPVAVSGPFRSYVKVISPILQLDPKHSRFLRHPGSDAGIHVPGMVVEHEEKVFACQVALAILGPLDSGIQAGMTAER